MKKILFALLAICLGLALATWVRHSSMNMNSEWADQSKRPTPTLNIQATGGNAAFVVELAISGKERAQGLMNRQELAKDHGMLFLFGRPKIIRMWMKDTYIPLDMIFIHDGRVVSLHKNAQPLDETTISSGVFASAVLEVNAGVIDQYKIQVGDKISF